MPFNTFPKFILLYCYAGLQKCNSSFPFFPPCTASLGRYLPLCPHTILCMLCLLTTVLTDQLHYLLVSIQHDYKFPDRTDDIFFICTPLVPCIQKFNNGYWIYEYMKKQILLKHAHQCVLQLLGASWVTRETMLLLTHLRHHHKMNLRGKTVKWAEFVKIIGYLNGASPKAWWEDHDW